MGSQTRTPTTNDTPKPAKSPWLSVNDCLDETALLLMEMARHCTGCKRTTDIEHLVDGRCPDCR